MKSANDIVKKWVENGDELEILQEAEQRGEQNGERKGMTRILEYLKSGHSIEEAEKMFALR